MNVDDYYNVSYSNSNETYKKYILYFPKNDYFIYRIIG